MLSGCDRVIARSAATWQSVSTNERVCTQSVVPAPARRGRRALRSDHNRRIVGHDHWACRPRSGRRYGRTNLYKFGSSCTGAPRSLAQPFATKERYGCGIPLAGARPTARVRSTFVGHDHWACRPRSGRQYRRTGLCAFGSSCTGAPSRRALRRTATDLKGPYFIPITN